MKKETWLIVANGSVARIFRVEKKKSLIEIDTLVHPESRLHNRDLVSDKPGRGFERSGPSRHSMEVATLPQQNEMNIFARHIANYLENACNKGTFDRIYLTANPVQLGLLREHLAHLAPKTSKLIAGEAAKDMTHLKPDEIINNLPFLL